MSKGTLEMQKLTDEHCEEDMDGQAWAQVHTHSTPEKESVDPTIAAIHPESDVVDNGYVIGWSAIASQKRFRVNHCCEVCSIRLKERPDLLHVHHLDRNKRNNEDKNLQARCVLCHSECEGHAHILRQISPSDLAHIQELRAKRGR